MLRFSAVFLLCVGLAAAEPARYQIILAPIRGGHDRQLAELFERQLPAAEIRSMAWQQRYRQYPHFPVTACTGEEYFALADGRRLVAFGCLNRENAAIEARRLREAIANDVRGRPKTVGQAMDAALASLAAGMKSDAAVFAEDAKNLPGGAAQTETIRRIKAQVR